MSVAPCTLRDSAANLGYRIGKQRNRDDIGEQIIVHCGIQRDRPLFQLMAHVGHADSLGRFIAKSCRSPASKSHQLKGWNRPISVIDSGQSERQLPDRKADIAYEEIIVRRSSQLDCPLSTA